MGGSSGGIIVRNKVQEMLNDPQVSGVIPAGSRSDMAHIMCKDAVDWNDTDIDHVTDVLKWLMKHPGAGS